MLADPSQARLLKRGKAEAIRAQQALDVERLCREMKLLMPEREFKFHPERGWKFDWAWPFIKVAIEIEGGIYQGGDHTTSMQGVLGDIEKYDTAASMGWLVLRATTLDEAPVLKVKYSLRTGLPLPRKVLPWMALADPAFRELLSAALELRRVQNLGMVNRENSLSGARP